MKHKESTKSAAMNLLALPMALLTVSCAPDAEADKLETDEVLEKFVDWHLGFATNKIQHDAALEADLNPRWALSELRFQRIWHDREDGYWIYYETSQPDVRPDRNEIWNVYRNDIGDLKVDIHFFDDTEKGLTYWGKGGNPAAFEDLTLDDITSRPGCNATYNWRPDFERFVGSNPHQECQTIGDSYIHQHVEFGLDEEGTLFRNDWHSFFDGEGKAKPSVTYNFGDQGPYVHLYTERYSAEKE